MTLPQVCILITSFEGSPDSGKSNVMSSSHDGGSKLLASPDRAPTTLLLRISGESLRRGNTDETNDTDDNVASAAKRLPIVALFPSHEP